MSRESGASVAMIDETPQRMRSESTRRSRQARRRVLRFFVRFSVCSPLFSVSRKQERTRASLSRSQKEKGKHCSRTVSRFPGDDVPGNHSWNQLRNSGGQCKLLRGASVGLSASASSLTPSCSYAEPAYSRSLETWLRRTEMGAILSGGSGISGKIRRRFNEANSTELSFHSLNPFLRQAGFSYLYNCD